MLWQYMFLWYLLFSYLSWCSIRAGCAADSAAAGAGRVYHNSILSSKQNRVGKHSRGIVQHSVRVSDRQHARYLTLHISIVPLEHR